jgi:pumilio family protein 6
MPAATVTKNAMAGIKRKSNPVKDVHVKESKKAKTDASLKSALKSSKSRPDPVKKAEGSSDSDSEDSDSDDGAISHSEPEEEDDSDEVPKATDGLHPDRAKAVVTNGKSMCLPLKRPHIDIL